MFRFVVRALVSLFVLLPHVIAAEPTTLKLSFFSSNLSMTYLAAVKPFVDAVNTEAKGLIEIKVYFSGALGKDIAQQPQLVLDGAFDMAFVVPGYTPNNFPDNTVIELPGLFHDMRDGTLVYTRLIALNALRGYDDFVVIGAYVTAPETIHGKVAINSIDDLKGKRIRVNNLSETAALEKLGAIPVPLPINQIAEAISSNKIDAAAVSLTPLSDYGIKRVATHHYLLGINGAPLALLMSRKSFEALPKSAQDIIRRHSGDWAAKRFIDTYAISERTVFEMLKSDPQRKVVMPSPQDRDIAQSAFTALIADWEAASPRNHELLTQVKTELAKLHTAD